MRSVDSASGPTASARPRRRGGRAAAAVVTLACCLGLVDQPGTARVVAATIDADGCGDLARKAEIMFSPRWQQAVAEFGGWLGTQTVYPPAEVRRIKNQFNDRVAGMSSYELGHRLLPAGAEHDLGLPREIPIAVGLDHGGAAVVRPRRS